MSEPRIIKKYPNRRLYDTSISRYVTLEEVRDLVLANEEFVVRDVKTDKDLTRGILLQIIAKQEHEDGQPLFSTGALFNLVRFYNKSVQSTAAQFLESSIGLLGAQQREMQKRLHEAMVSNPLETFTKLTEENLSAWQDMQRQFLRAAMGNAKSNRESDDD